jgi:predicted N-acetyltransferase YhbS
VLSLAFGRKNEGYLVEHLRVNPSFLPELSILAETKNRIIGHILFLPIRIVWADVRFPSLALAPISVVPEYQGRGVGKQLVMHGLKRSAELGWKSIIVLGHAAYYPRFGFRPASKWDIRAPFEVPDDVFLAMELVENGLKGVSGTVQYPKEFDDV